MLVDRVRVARVVIALILLLDAGVFLSLAIAAVVYDDPEWVPYFALLTLPFLIAALALPFGPGMKRSYLARIVAWGVAVWFPVLVFVLIAFAGAWGKGWETSDYWLLGCALLVSVVHLVIPAAIAWARFEGHFLWQLARHTGELLLIEGVMLAGAFIKG